VFGAGRGNFGDRGTMRAVSFFDAEIFMRAMRRFAIPGLVCVSAAFLAAGDATQAGPKGLNDPGKKEIAMELVSAAENSSLDWKAQYAYIEYNVEGNAEENRGYTAGIIGFTSRTHDMLELVERYEKAEANNPLSPFLPVLRKVDGTSSKEGLGKPFMDAWKKAGADPVFRKCQDGERDREYFDPAVKLATADGLQELGQFAYYDAAVMHGFDGARRVRRNAMKTAKTPAQGGDEKTYIAAYLVARKAEMKREQGHQDTSRVDTLEKVFLDAGNLTLALPLVFKTYGDGYRIDALPKD
jgi:chitosanase